MSVKSLFGGGGGSKSASRAQTAALQEQTKLAQQQTKMLNEIAGIGRDQYDFYKKTYQPVETKVAGQAMAGITPDYEGITNLGGAASQKVGEQYQIARDSHLRGLTRRGVSVNSGERKNLDLSMALAEAADRAGAFTRANMEEQELRRGERKYAEETTFNRRAQVAGMGQANTGVSTMAAAAGGLSSPASMYGNQAQAYGQIAERNAQAKGGLLSSLFDIGTRVALASSGMPGGIG